MENFWKGLYNFIMTTEEFKKHFKENYKSTSSFKCGLSLFFVDIFMLMACIGIGFFIVNLFSIGNINFKSFINYSVFLPIFTIFFIVNGLYPGIMIPHAEEVKRCTQSVFFTFLIIILVILFSNMKNIQFTKKIVKESHDLQIIIALVIALIFSIPVLPGIRSLSKHFFARFNYWGVPAVIYTTGDSAFPVVDRLIANKHFCYRPVIIIDSNKPSLSEYKGIPIFENSDTEIFKVIKELKIKNAFICSYEGDLSSIMSYYRYTVSVSKKQNSFTCTQHLKEIADIIAFSSTHNLTIKPYYFLKRLVDIFIVVLFTPILIPLFIILSLLVKCTSKGPVFYGHKRIGKNGKEFKCWKFRSMVSNSQEILEEILRTDPVRAAQWEAERKFVDDPRVTKIGKILRKTSLDELPQLFNVLVGQMSLVGPRPVTAPEVEKYGKAKDFVLSVLPGLTGLWQVNGRSETSYEERIYFDGYYIQNWSVWLDLWILIKTIWVVLKGKGAY